MERPFKRLKTHEYKLSHLPVPVRSVIVSKMFKELYLKPDSTKSNKSLLTCLCYIIMGHGVENDEYGLFNALIMKSDASPLHSAVINLLTKHVNIFWLYEKPAQYELPWQIIQQYTHRICVIETSDLPKILFQHKSLSTTVILSANNISVFEYLALVETLPLLIYSPIETFHLDYKQINMLNRLLSSPTKLYVKVLTCSSSPFFLKPLRDAIVNKKLQFAYISEQRKFCYGVEYKMLRLDTDMTDVEMRNLFTFFGPIELLNVCSVDGTDLRKIGQQLVLLGKDGLLKQLKEVILHRPSNCNMCDFITDAHDFEAIISQCIRKEFMPSGTSFFVTSNGMRGKNSIKQLIKEHMNVDVMFAVKANNEESDIEDEIESEDEGFD